MNEEKLKLVLKQLTTLANLQAEKNKTLDQRINLIKEMCVNLDIRLKAIK